jgi:ABC-type branched-subunit amino acid transport system permease subunit
MWKLMAKNLFNKFGKVFLYALGAVVVAALAKLVEVYQPSDPTQQAIWTYILVPAIAGLIAAIRRWIQWDPKKANPGAPPS